MYLVLFMLNGFSIVNSTLAPLNFLYSFFFYALVLKNKTSEFNNYSEKILLLMILSLPFSWINFLGTNYNILPISWFNVFGIAFIFSIFLKKNKLIPKKLLILFTLSLLVIFLSVIPLLYSNKLFLNEATAQFIVLSFHNIIIFCSIFLYNSITPFKSEIYLSNYIRGAYYTCIMLILQYFSINYFSLNFGSIKYYLNRQSLLFLFSDASHGSLYLATATFLAFTYLFKKRNLTQFIRIFIMFCGVALTSARTGLFVLIIFVFIFVLFKLSTVTKKIIGTIISIALFQVGNIAMKSVRPMDNGDLLDGSGRINGYISALNLLKERPLTGYGYSQNFLAKLLNQPIPHLSLLQYSLHTGFIITFFLFLIQLIVLVDSHKKHSIIAWVIAMTLVGTCLIPDLFATRFLTVLCVLSIMQTNTTTKYKNFDYI